MSIAAYIDHTLLKPFCTDEDIQQLCSEAMSHHFAAVCVPPCYVSLAREMLRGSDVKTCSVAGFPLGYNTTMTKLKECQYLIEAGAEEVDVVVNISMIKSGNWKEVSSEVLHLKKLIASNGAVFKLIFETAYLNADEIMKLADICLEAGVDYLKTSTGFAPRGAELDTIKAIKERIGSNAKIKASGGISDYETALAFIEVGADRIGTSSGVKIMTASLNS